MEFITFQISTFRKLSLEVSLQTDSLADSMACLVSINVSLILLANSTNQINDRCIRFKFGV